jgi:hypothetical protein
MLSSMNEPKKTSPHVDMVWRQAISSRAGTSPINNLADSSKTNAAWGG